MFVRKTLEDSVLLRPVRRCHEDGGVTGDEGDCDRRSSDTMQRRISSLKYSESELH